MLTFDILKAINTDKTFRVESVMSRFDLQTNNIKETFKGEIELDWDWQIGAIIGPSGSGKSTIAKYLFKKELVNKFNYKAKSIVDDMPEDCSVNEIIKMFNSIGFSSPPSWLKPYSVLSTNAFIRSVLR